jgi:predicted transcriptional regulator
MRKNPRRILSPQRLPFRHPGRAPTPFSMEIALTVPQRVSKLNYMVVHLKPETESRLQELAATTGRAPEELIEDAMTGYLAELTQVRDMLDGRYDEIKSGRVQPIDGEEAFIQLRQKSQDRRRP